jgi:hypothetical protein
MYGAILHGHFLIISSGPLVTPVDLVSFTLITALWSAIPRTLRSGGQNFLAREITVLVRQVCILMFASICFGIASLLSDTRMYLSRKTRVLNWCVCHFNFLSLLLPLEGPYWLRFSTYGKLDVSTVLDKPSLT